MRTAIRRDGQLVTTMELLSTRDPLLAQMMRDKTERLFGTSDLAEQMRCTQRHARRLLAKHGNRRGHAHFITATMVLSMNGNA